MSEETEKLTKALVRRVAESITLGKASLAKEQAAQDAFHAAMKEKVRPLIQEMERVKRNAANRKFLSLDEFASFISTMGVRKATENCADGAAAVGSLAAIRRQGGYAGSAIA